MKHISILFITMLVTFTGLAQENQKRYESARFKINQGQSEGAVYCDFEFDIGLLSERDREYCEQVIYSKDLVIDIQFMVKENKEVCRVSYLKEFEQSDVKLLFIQATAIEVVSLGSEKELLLN